MGRAGEKSAGPVRAPAVGAADLACAILGPLEVRVDDREVPVSRGVERLLLNILAAHAGHTVTGAALLDLIYPGATAASATRSLRTAVWRLRRTLGPGAGAVVSAHGGYRLDPGRCRVDAELFGERRTRGRAALELGDPDAAAGQLAGALALWRGPALADWRDHPVAAPIASRLEELRLGVVEDLGAALLAAGRAAEAEEALQRLVADHPTREQAWALLVEAATSEGRQADAWRAFEAGRRHLADAGREPGIELRRAGDRLGPGQRSPTRPGRHPLPPALDLYRSRSLVGRERELWVLGDLVATAATGRTRLAVLRGEPGAGKTHLAAAVADRARSRGPVWSVAGDPYLNLAYRPVTDLVRDLLDGLDDLTRRRHLAGPVGWLLDAARGPGMATADGDRGRYLIFEAVAELVTDAVSGRAGLIVIDDAQWIPATSLHLLRHLLVTRPDLPLAVVLTLRHGPTLAPDQERPLADLGRLPTAEVLRLSGLDVDDVGTLLGLETGVEVPLATAQQVHQLTGGNPLYVRALAPRTSSGQPLDLEAGLGPEDDVHGAIDGHLDALDPGMVQLLELASVCGRRFDRRTLTAVVARAGRPGDPGSVTDALERATRAGLVARTGLGEGYTFVHELIRQALYRRLPTDERPELHLAVARAIERLTEASERHDDELAHHFERAWPACPAAVSCRYLERAGRQAAHQLDFAQSKKFFEAGLALLAAEGTARDRHLELHLRTLLGRAHGYGGQGERAREVLAAAWAEARDLGDDSQAADAAIHHAETVGSDAAEDVRAASCSMLEETAARSGAVHHQLHARALLQLRRLDPVGGGSRVTAALNEARKGGDQPRVAALLGDEWWQRTGDDQVAVADELVELGVTAGDARIEGFGRLKRWISQVHLGRARYDDPVASVIDDLVDAARAPDLRWTWTAWRANVAMSTGRLADAKRLAAQTLTVPDLERRPYSIPRPRVVVAYQMQMDYLCRVMGEPGPALAAPVAQTWMWRTVDLRGFGALGRHARTELAAMVDALTAHRGPLTLDWLFHATTLGYLSTLAGDPAGVAAARAALLPLQGRYILSLGIGHGAVDQQLGWLDMHAGDLDGAVGWLERGIEVNRAVGATWHEARTAYNLSCALWLRDRPGDRDRAKALVTDVLASPMVPGMADLTVGGWPPRSPPRAAYAPSGLRDR